MLIGLVYCVIQPIIAPLALIYFAVGVLIWKYQVVYVYVPLVESGGKVWVLLDHMPWCSGLHHCTCCLPWHTPLWFPISLTAHLSFQWLRSE